MIKGKKTYRSGLSLVETAIVLAVAGLVIGSIWIAASAALERYQQTKAIGDIVQTFENTRSLLRGVSATLAPIQPSSLVFPADVATSTSSAKSPWDGASFSAYYYGGVYMGLVLENLPVSICTAFAPKLGSTFQSVGYLGYNGKFIYSDGDNEFDLSTPAAAAANCAGADSNDGRIRVILLVKL